MADASFDATHLLIEALDSVQAPAGPSLGRQESAAAELQLR